MRPTIVCVGVTILSSDSCAGPSWETSPAVFAQGPGPAHGLRVLCPARFDNGGIRVRPEFDERLGCVFAHAEVAAREPLIAASILATWPPEMQSELDGEHVLNRHREIAIDGGDLELLGLNDQTDLAAVEKHDFAIAGDGLEALVLPPLSWRAADGSLFFSPLSNLARQRVRSVVRTSRTAAKRNPCEEDSMRVNV